MRTWRVEGANQLKILAFELKAADKALTVTMRRNLRAAVAPIAADVKNEAAKFSKSIPPTIAIRTQFTGKKVGVWVASLASRLPEGHKPLARLQEFGSQRNPGKIRHPGRGGPRFSIELRDDPWIEQPAHPFLIPTALKHAPEVRLAMRKVMDETARAAGFK